MIDVAATAAYEGAVFENDQVLLPKAKRLLALLDEAVAQARVDARQAAATEPVPEELTTVQTPAPAGDDKSSVAGADANKTPAHS